METERAPALAEFIAATARSVVPLFLGAALLEAGLLAAAPARSSTFLRNGLGRFSTSLKSYLGSGACASDATDAEVVTLAGADDAVEADDTADVEAARFILVRAELDDALALDAGHVPLRRRGRRALERAELRAVVRRFLHRALAGLFQRFDAL